MAGQKNTDAADRRIGRHYHRAYQACINCRKRRIKCILDHDGHGRRESTCTRCKRELRQCIFTADRGASNSNSFTSTQRTVFIEQKQRTPGASPSASGSQPPFDTSLVLSDARESIPEATNTNINENYSLAECTQSVNSLGGPFPRIHHGRDRILAAALTPSNAINQPSNTLPGVDQDYPAVKGHDSQWCTMRHPLSSPSQKTLSTWEDWRFVKTGLLTAQEAVTYIDLFFQNMAILSPIVHGYYKNHENHHTLLTRDPVLCCTIVALSSRYHLLGVDGGLTRGYHIHDRLWQHTQSLFHLVMWNERRAVKDQMRYMGTVESMILVTEWHPRASHMPSENDYQNTHLSLPDEAQYLSLNKVPNKWLQEVEEIAERSDRASWMLLGNALTLSHELDIIESKEEPAVQPAVQSSSSPQNMSYSDYLVIRRNRLSRILYIYISQLASRLGCSYPKTPFHQVVASSISHPQNSPLDEQWHNHVSSWIELSRLIRSSSEFLFPSKSVTKELLRSGRYGAFLDHFRPLLDQWWKQHSEIFNEILYHKLLLIDYHFIRLFINSLALQAVSHPAYSQQNLSLGSEFERTSDFPFIREVIDSCSQILQMVIHLAEGDHLNYMPTRVHIRFASAAIYLIHALALGVRRTELDSKIALVDVAVQALHVHAVDDVHLSVRYASLLQQHVKGLRQRFVRIHDNAYLFPFTTATQIEHPSDSIESDISAHIVDSTNPDSRVQPAIVSDLPLEDVATSITGNDWFVMPVATTIQTQRSDFMEFLFEMDLSDRKFFWEFV